MLLTISPGICGGPVQREIGTRDFWETRARYIVDSYKDYFQKGPDLQYYEQKMKLVSSMLKDDFHYGFGDVQYFAMLHRLKPLYHERQHE